MPLLTSNSSRFVESGLGEDFKHLMEPAGWTFSSAQTATLPAGATLLEKPIPGGTILFARYADEGMNRYFVERRHPSQLEGTSGAISFMRSDLRSDDRLSRAFADAHQIALIARDGD